jgi:hypothetical protein
MSIALQSGYQNRQKRAQSLATDSIGRLPEHDQCRASGLIVQQLSNTGLTALGRWLSVQDAYSRFLVLASSRDELVQDLALHFARSGPISSADGIGEFRPRGERHFRAHSPSWMERAISSHTRWRVTFSLRQCDTRFHMSPHNSRRLSITSLFLCWENGRLLIDAKKLCS